MFQDFIFRDSLVLCHEKVYEDFYRLIVGILDTEDLGILYLIRKVFNYLFNSEKKIQQKFRNIFAYKILTANDVFSSQRNRQNTWSAKGDSISLDVISVSHSVLFIIHSITKNNTCSEIEIALI